MVLIDTMISMITYGYWAADMLNVTFFLKDLLGSIAQSLYISFFNIITPFKLFNPLVKIVI